MGIVWFLAAAAVICGAVLLAAYICFRIAFLAKPAKVADPDSVDIPEGEIYEVFRPQMEQWVREARALPRKTVSVTSFDGLKLYGTYYEFSPDSPIELMFHGYRGNAERDLSGGVQRCFALGRSALIVDQRCCGRSEGKAITFGILEHRDCSSWLAFMQQRFGPDRKIILTGISMGAATVMMMADKELPENVIGILADCGYTSAKDIIQVVIRQMGLPPKLCYPFVRLGAKLFAHFDPDAHAPVESLKHSRVPVIFFHGESDDFVPCYMSRENYDACASRKMLVTVPGAGHGLSYPVAPEVYLNALRDFFGESTTV